MVGDDDQTFGLTGCRGREGVAVGRGGDPDGADPPR